MGLSDVLSSIAFFLQFFLLKFFYLGFICFDKTTIRRAVDDEASQDTKHHDVYSQKEV